MTHELLGFLSRAPESILNIRTNSIAALRRLKIYSVRDLLFHKPCGYLSKRIDPPHHTFICGEHVVLRLNVLEAVRSKHAKLGLRIQCSIYGGGYITLIFFRPPPAFIATKLYVGNTITAEGKIERYGDKWQIIHPELLFSKPVTIEPIYPLTYACANKQLHQYILRALGLLPPTDSLDEHIALYKALEDREYPTFFDCLKAIHEPTTLSLERYNYRLLIDEIFANQLACLSAYSEEPSYGHQFPSQKQLQSQIIENLGFTITQGQQQVIEEIEADQVQAKTMVRLLQGDVGVGKTLVALLTMVNVISTGAQAVLMAPTDLLTKQHYQFFSNALSALGFNVGILTSRMTAKQRRDTLASLSAGHIQVVIGTHAVFQDNVTFHNLKYIIIDEQHRFGVLQRLSLISKGDRPDLLVMTATPIPRSLALSLFGNISTSELRTKISGRSPIKTSTIASNSMPKIMASLQTFLSRGEKIYWVCPLVQAKDNQDDGIALQDVATRFAELDAIYQGQVEMIHGQMPIDQRDERMAKFRDGQISILVATTVIEVGIDVPQATLIVIEDAQQFGLAGLHQLRGRVGRGDKQSYCLLVYNTKYLSEIAKKRLEVICNTHDGFEIAKQDLILRGQGEILGEKQSGNQRFFFVDNSRDAALFERINKLVTDNTHFIPNRELLVSIFKSTQQELNQVI